MFSFDNEMCHCNLQITRLTSLAHYEEMCVCVQVLCICKTILLGLVV